MQGLSTFASRQFNKHSQAARQHRRRLKEADASPALAYEDFYCLDAEAGTLCENRAGNWGEPSVSPGHATPQDTED